METFSERKGLKDKPTLQIDRISDRLKNRLWNIFYSFENSKITPSYTGYYESTFDRDMELLIKEILCNHFSMKINQIPNDAYKILECIEGRFDKLEWNEIYDFFEYILSNLQYHNANSFIEKKNEYLTEENSGYRLSDGIFIPIISSEEPNEIEKASKSKTSQVKDHLQKAKEYLSPSRKEADYRNSIKESISAVESLVRTIANNDKGLLKNPHNTDLNIHPALKKALDKIYAYTSDAPAVSVMHIKPPPQPRKKQDLH